MKQKGQFQKGDERGEFLLELRAEVWKASFVCLGSSRSGSTPAPRVIFHKDMEYSMPDKMGHVEFIVSVTEQIWIDRLPSSSLLNGLEENVFEF